MSSKHREAYWCLVGSSGGSFGTAIGINLYIDGFLPIAHGLGNKV